MSKQDRPIEEILPAETIDLHRAVFHFFVKHGKEFNFNLTTHNIFLILMFNADADKRSDTFGEVADIRYADIAERIEKKESTVQKEIVKLVKAGLVERHPINRYGFILPSMML